MPRGLVAIDVYRPAMMMEAAVRLSFRTEIAHVSDIVGTDGVSRPSGVRHEIASDPDPAFVVVREVWFWTDSGDDRHVDSRRIAINDLVHVLLNMTEAERRFFAETRTTYPDRNWDGVPMNGTIEQLKTILAEYQGQGVKIDPQRGTMAPWDWQGIADKCKAASIQCTTDDDGIWFLDGKLTIEQVNGSVWEWVWTQKSTRFFSVQADAGETDGS